jgi:hypothetical protein
MVERLNENVLRQLTHSHSVHGEQLSPVHGVHSLNEPSVTSLVQTMPIVQSGESHEFL